MSKIYLLIVLIFSVSSYSQTLNGSVFDENKSPIPGVSIYIDGTTIGTITDGNGKYSLDVNQNPNALLIIRALGYETIIIQKPLENNNLSWYLIPKQTQLREVVIKKDYFTRKQKLAVFREQLLGQTKAGKSCSIDNEDDVIFDYDYKKNILYASLDNPLRITNKYLGYNIEFNLEEFYVKFNRKSIKSIDATESFYLGTSLYREVKKDAKIEKIRSKAYDESIMNFFKVLANNSWKEEKYAFYKGSYPASPEKYFTITTEGDYKKISLLHNDIENVLTKNGQPKFHASYNLLHKKKQSSVIFSTNEFYIDQFGNNSNNAEIKFSGYLGTKRLGDLMPSNYLPLKEISK